MSGVYGLRSGAMGKAVLPLDIWLHIFGYFILSHTLVLSVQCLAQESSQKIMQKEKTATDKRTKTFPLYFPLFTEFNNHSVDEGVFPQYIEMVESPS